MTPSRFQSITGRYPSLRIALAGDFCLDRYLEIDPARVETSIETGLPVHNVVRVRAQPGAAGTILNNLVALGIGEIYPIGFCGEDGEGYELRRALQSMPGVKLEHFIATSERRTFTYCKPLVIEPGQPPRELNRLDSKNWTPTPAGIEKRLAQSLREVAEKVDAIILMDQVDRPQTGVITSAFLETVRAVAEARPKLFIIADSRRSLRGYPPVCFKMNAAELAALTGIMAPPSPDLVASKAAELARSLRKPVFVTMAENGIWGASAEGAVEHQLALPLRGPIDIVGAGDSVTANLAAAWAANGSLSEVVALANAGASIVVHQLGTTGTASVPQLAALLQPSA